MFVVVARAAAALTEPVNEVVAKGVAVERLESTLSIAATVYGPG